MPLPIDLKWIEQRFGRYHIVYLDPLVCQLASTTIWPSRFFARDQMPVHRFTHQLISTLKVKSTEKSAMTYLDSNGLGTRFKKDLVLQQRVTRLVESSLSAHPPLIPRFDDLDHVFGARNSLIGHDSEEGSLVALDSMFASRAALAEDVGLSLPWNYEVDPRSVECILLDHYPGLLTLHDRRIGLSVDRLSFYGWTEDFTKILLAGWYPFMRTVGFYAFSSGGQPFIKVLAFLAKPFPSLNEVLQPDAKTHTTNNLPGVLAHHISMIRTRIAQFEVAHSPDARGAPTARLTFAEYRQYMYPVYIVQMLCGLNGISSRGLRRGARSTYNLLKEYLEQLQTLYKYKDFLSLQVVEMAPPNSIEALLDVTMQRQTDDETAGVSKQEAQELRDRIPAGAQSSHPELHRASGLGQRTYTQLNIKKNADELHPGDINQLISGIASKTSTSIDEIKLLYVLPGSVRVTLEMPEDCAKRLMSLYLEEDPFVTEFQIQNIKIAKYRLAPNTAKRLLSAPMPGTTGYYEVGIRNLREMIVYQPENVQKDFYVLKDRLENVLRDIDLFGVEPGTRTEKNRIVDSLSQMVYSIYPGYSFADLCAKPDETRNSDKNLAAIAALHGRDMLNPPDVSQGTR